MDRLGQDDVGLEVEARLIAGWGDRLQQPTSGSILRQQGKPTVAGERRGVSVARFVIPSAKLAVHGTGPEVPPDWHGFGVPNLVASRKHSRIESQRSRGSFFILGRVALVGVPRGAVLRSPPLRWNVQNPGSDGSVHSADDQPITGDETLGSFAGLVCPGWEATAIFERGSGSVRRDPET